MDEISGRLVAGDPPPAAPIPPLVSRWVDVAGQRLHVRHGGSGPPVLLLHGHPQTSYVWHAVAARLAGECTVVAPDLPGYGDSDKPRGAPRHANYSKRAMADQLAAVMQALGYAEFVVVGHDRGGRVAHRMALDHERSVAGLLLLDIAPTLAMYEKTGREFATAYYHWFFLIQPEPLPETLIGGDPALYLSATLRGRAGTLDIFTPEALAEYERCILQPGAVHAICEDYRAAAGIDLEHDAASRREGRSPRCPVRVLWGSRGVIERCFDPPAEWRAVAPEATGAALDCGHYVPEEKPSTVVAETLALVRAWQGARR